MSNLIVQPGFEAAGGWTYQQNCERTDGYGSHGGNFAARLFPTTSIVRGIPPVTIRNDAILHQDGIPLVSGHTYPVAAWLDSDAAFSTDPLEVHVDPGDGNYAVVDSVLPGELGVGWQPWAIGSFVAVGTVGRIMFVTVNTFQIIGSFYWLLDDVEIPSTVAIKLTERAINAIVATFQTYFTTEAAAIDADRADGIVLAVPDAANYYKRPKSEIAGATVHMEVFERSFPFEAPAIDAQYQRAQYDAGLVCRITCFNRNGETADAMFKRMRRYGSLMKIMFVKHPFLENNDSMIQGAVATEFQPHHETEGEDVDKVLKVRVTMPVTIKCTETA